MKRAKEILERGIDRANIGEPNIVRGGTIYVGDTFAAYMLLESFVGEIEKLQHVLTVIGIRASMAILAQHRPSPKLEYALKEILREVEAVISRPLGRDAPQSGASGDQGGTA